VLLSFSTQHEPPLYQENNMTATIKSKQQRKEWTARRTANFIKRHALSHLKPEQADFIHGVIMQIETKQPCWFKPCECFCNAQKLALWATGRIAYVEGIAGGETHHGWNTIDGEPFDITDTLNAREAYQKYGVPMPRSWVGRTGEDYRGQAVDQLKMLLHTAKQGFGPMMTFGEAYNSAFAEKMKGNRSRRNL
jgi:hypothetical protein